MDRYFDDYNPDLLALIPPDARTILEVGCGSGRLCEAYRRINPGVEWWGIEKNWEAAKLAEGPGRCDQVDNDDVEEGFPDRLDDVDCLVLGDILEHLRDPWKMLKCLASSMKPGAQVLASIPNVQHYCVILSLLRGHWNYASEGLLDWTHLRFFTLESIREMFEKAGLDVFEVRGRRIDFDQELADWKEILPKLAMPDLARQSMVYQYLVRSVRPMLKARPGNGEITLMDKVLPAKMHIHTIGDGTICERPRLHEPAAMLTTIPGVKCTHSQFYLGALNDLGKLPDILIQQRFRMFDPVDQARLVESGCLIVAEIDDDPEALEGLHHCDFMPLRAAHAVQVTTEVMAETCRRWNPNVSVFPNQIANLRPPRKYQDGPPTLFYGSLHREKDWEPIMPALNRVLADHPEIKFQVVADRTFHDALTCPLKYFHAFCPWPTYRSILRLCDIAIVPLEDTRFNRHKSDIKFLECAAEGVAVLASEVVYGDTAFHSARGDKLIVVPTMMTYNHPEQFERMLRSLITVPQMRRELTANAHVYVRGHRLLSQHYRHRHDVYTHWLSQREALSRDLMERCPQLRSRSPEPAHA